MPEPRLTRPIPFARQDILEALPDFLLLRAGQRVPDAHPVAELLNGPDERVSLLDIAAHLSGHGSGRTGSEATRQLTTSDFGEALAVALSRVPAISYDKQSAEHGSICRDIVARNLRPISFPELDLGELSFIPKSGGPIQFAPILASAGVTGEPSVFGARFLVSRQMLINGDADIITSATEQLSGHAARIEAAQIAAVIQANGNLGDGAPLIGAGNSVSGGVATITGLGNAAAKLRTNTTGVGNVGNIKPAFWVVPGDSEIAAAATVASLYAGVPGIQVICNPWLPSGASYLLGDPAIAPVIARMALNFPNTPSVSRVRTPLTYDGQAFRFEFITGIQAIGRNGI